MVMMRRSTRIKALEAKLASRLDDGEETGHSFRADSGNAATSSSSAGRDEDNLTSPSTSKSMHRSAVGLTVREAVPPDHESRVSANLTNIPQRLDTGRKGTMHNPIILEEHSPRYHLNNTTKRKRYDDADLRPQEVHVQHQLSNSINSMRPAIVPIPIPASGITFTGDKGQDMYRMMNAQMMAMKSALPVRKMSEQVSRGGPFETHCRVLPFSKWRQVGQKEDYISPYAKHNAQMNVSLNDNNVLSSSNRARQSVSDSTSTQSKDIRTVGDQTRPFRPTSFSSPATFRPRDGQRLNIYCDQTDYRSQLITQNSILDSLLHFYPSSHDQQKLRNDIANLISIQQNCATDWLNSETRRFYKHSRSSTDSAVSLGSQYKQRLKGSSMGLGDHMLGERDEEVRLLLSAGATMWQDGSGLGVADVFSAVNENESRKREESEERNEEKESTKVY